MKGHPEGLGAMEAPRAGRKLNLVIWWTRRQDVPRAVRLECPGAPVKPEHGGGAERREARGGEAGGGLPAPRDPPRRLRGIRHKLLFHRPERGGARFVNTPVVRGPWYFPFHRHSVSNPPHRLRDSVTFTFPWPAGRGIFVDRRSCSRRAAFCWRTGLQRSYRPPCHYPCERVRERCSLSLSLSLSHGRALSIEHCPLPIMTLPTS